MWIGERVQLVRPAACPVPLHNRLRRSVSTHPLSASAVRWPSNIPAGGMQMESPPWVTRRRSTCRPPPA
eukprot:scaffold1616_cov395-Prasinococcus_capsulatus_cf.AAC.8